MGCVVHLQRVAAYVALDQGMPAHTLDFETVWNDPIRLHYYRQFRVERAGRNLWESLRPAAARREASTSSLGRAQSPFAHLMYHEAEFGYFLPRPLQEMLIAYPPLHDWCEPVGIGSSHALHQECLQLAERLGLPAEIELEELDQLRRQDDGVVTGSGWRAFALECFVCKALLTGAEISIRSGCALHFG